MSVAAPTVTWAPKVSAPRASAGRSERQYSAHERTIRVSWPHSEAAARNDMALKMMASEPNVSGSMWREHSANMVNPSTDAVNLIASAVALPLSTSFCNSERAIRSIMLDQLSLACTHQGDVPDREVRPVPPGQIDWRLRTLESANWNCGIRRAAPRTPSNWLSGRDRGSWRLRPWRRAATAPEQESGEREHEPHGERREQGLLLEDAVDADDEHAKRHRRT